MSIDETTTRNIEYYEALYSHGNSLTYLLHGCVSFDQQSKSRPNYCMAKRVLGGSDQAVKKYLKVLDYGSGWGTFLLKWPRGSSELFCYDIAVTAMRTLINSAPDR